MDKKKLKKNADEPKEKPKRTPNSVKKDPKNSIAHLLITGSNHFLETIFNATNNGIVITDPTGHIRKTNKKALEMLGYREEELFGKYISIISDYHGPMESSSLMKQLFEKGSVENYVISYRRKNGTNFSAEANITLLRDSTGTVIGGLSAIRHRTEHKQAQKLIEEKELDLTQKASELEELNAALNVLLHKRSEYKREQEENVLFNFYELVEPYLLKLKKECTDSRHRVYLEAIENTLNEIASSFSRNLLSRAKGLTATELQMANHIKYGMSTKEISSLLNISARTVESHRNSIRKKLGILDRGTDLRTYLLSFS